MSESRLPVWLIASLLVNMLLIGLLVGGAIAGGPGRGNHPPRLDEGEIARTIVRAAPEAERPEIRRAFRSTWAETRQLRKDRRTAQSRVNEVMIAEDYDPEEMQSAFAAMRAADAALQSRIQTLLADRLGALEPEQRQELAKAMQRHDRGGRGPRGPGGFDKRPPPEE